MGITHAKRVAESFEHKRMKQYMFENLHTNNDIKRMELEYNVKSRRADLYGELADGKKFVIEFQNSKIRVEEIVERTKLYNENEMFVLWILNGVSYNRTPQNEDGKNISIEEDKLHRMYKGRVYYMNMTKQGLESFIYPLHFTKCFDVTFKKWIFPKYYAKKRSIVCGSSPSLELVFMNSKKSFKLARFRDKSIEQQCFDDIKVNIKRICALKHRESKRSWDLETSLQIQVKTIISHLEKKYGYFLPYNLMKWRKKALKIRKVGFMLDEMW
jgi:competence CoiA-like predicted nuclease